MPLHLKDENHCEHNVRGPMMLSSVPIMRGCEQCIRKMFTEAMEAALAECKECGSVEPVVGGLACTLRTGHGGKHMRHDGYDLLASWD